MNKFEYEEPKMDVIKLGNMDVIVTSGLTQGDPIADPEPEIDIND